MELEKNYSWEQWDNMMFSTGCSRRANGIKRSEPGMKQASGTVRYDAKTDRVVVSRANRAEFHLPIEAFAHVARGTLEERASVRMSDDADGIRWDVFDVDYYWPFLMAVMLGPTTRGRTSAKLLGGAKGGRLRKRPAAT